MWLKFEQRTEPSPLMSYLSPAIAVGLMLLSGMALTFSYLFKRKAMATAERAVRDGAVAETAAGLGAKLNAAAAVPCRGR